MFIRVRLEQALHPHVIEEINVIISILQKRKLRFREVKHWPKYTQLLKERAGI